MAGNGNIETLQPCRTKEEARVRGAAGGRKSGEVRRKKKAIADMLKDVLYRRSEVSDGLIADDLVEGVVAKLLMSPDVKDLKTVVEILGELQNKVSVDANIDAKVKEVFELPNGSK